MNDALIFCVQFFTLSLVPSFYLFNGGILDFWHLKYIAKNITRLCYKFKILMEILCVLINIRHKYFTNKFSQILPSVLYRARKSWRDNLKAVRKIGENKSLTSGGSVQRFPTTADKYSQKNLTSGGIRFSVFRRPTFYTY